MKFQNKYLYLLCAILVLSVLCIFSHNSKNNKTITQANKPNKLETVNENNKLHKHKYLSPSIFRQKDDKIEKADLYLDTPYDIPYTSIMEISKLSPNVKAKIDRLLEDAQGFYYAKFNKSKMKLFIILQNPIDQHNRFSRHDLEVVEISLKDKKTELKNAHLIGYNGEDEETSQIYEEKNNDVWEFDKSVEPNRPLKHIAYTDNGNVKFTEYWNYSVNNPVKYEMRDENDKIVSIKKETAEGDSKYRQEHIFYNDDGTTKMNLSVDYDGANLTKVTYYDSKDNDDSGSIISEYREGNKVSENIYNSEYQLEETIKRFEDANNKPNLQLFDAQNQKLLEITSKEEL